MFQNIVKSMKERAVYWYGTQSIGTAVIKTLWFWHFYCLTLKALKDKCSKSSAN